jgi:hypothetical protein
MVMNDAIVHLSVETLPFGGVGASGMGAYHGRYTFLTFSHAKSILVRGFGALGGYPYIQCCGSMTFWGGSGAGSADPRL